MKRYFPVVTVCLVTSFSFANTVFAATIDPTDSKGWIAFVCNHDGHDELCAIHPDGTDETKLTNDYRVNSKPAWSPDGKKLAFVGNAYASAAKEEIFILDVETGVETQLTNNMDEEAAPSWSPDATKIAFSRGDVGIFTVDVASGTEARVTAPGPPFGYIDDIDPFWVSPSKIFFTREHDEVDPYSDIYSVDPNVGSRTEKQLTNASAFEHYGLPKVTSSTSPVTFLYDDGNTIYDEIYSIDQDGTNLKQWGSISPSSVENPFPKGDSVVYDEGGNIFTLSKLGAASVRLTTTGDNSQPAWQP